MFNIQNLIILFVLLATTLVNSVLKPRRLPPPGVQVTDSQIRNFAFKVNVSRRIPGVRENHVDYFRSWDCWNGTPSVFKENCVIEYWNELERRGLNEQSGDSVLAPLAYRALDTIITEIVTNDLRLLDRNPLLRGRMELIQNGGEYLKFAAYLRSNLRNEDM